MIFLSKTNKRGTHQRIDQVKNASPCKIRVQGRLSPMDAPSKAVMIETVFMAIKDISEFACIFPLQIFST